MHFGFGHDISPSLAPITSDIEERELSKHKFLNLSLILDSYS